MKIPVSVIILTLNEELHIERCLNNVMDWADEVIIIDSFSTDKTLEIAEKYGSKVYQHKFENQAQQFNWALENVEIKNEWIFRLDADEYLTPELKDEITQTLINTDKEPIYADKKSALISQNQYKSVSINGFLIKRRVYFMGKWIKWGGYYPSWFLRFFRKGQGEYERREMDEHLVVRGSLKKLRNDFVDENLKGLEEWTERHNNYSTKEIKAHLREQSEKRAVNLKGQAGKKRKIKQGFYYKLPIFFRVFAYFIYRYFFRLGFLDGRRGFIFHFLQGLWYRFLVDAKLYEFKKHKINGRD